LSVFGLEKVVFMPVNNTHPDYDLMMAAWSRARDVLGGEEAVKAAGEKYLVKLASQSDEEYQAYKMRAAFFNATARTLAGYIGMIFRKPPYLRLAELPELGTGNPSPQPSPPGGMCVKLVGRGLSKWIFWASPVAGGMRFCLRRAIPTPRPSQSGLPRPMPPGN
jgi:hypothetical protein